MTSNSGRPSWRPLTVLAMVVVAAHVLVLQASPAQLGSGVDLDAPGAITLTTRSIEATPVAPAATAPATPAAARPAKAPQTISKKPQNEPLAQSNRALEAPESIALAVPDAALPSPAETTTLAAPTLTAPLSVPSPALQPASAANAAASAAGPATTPVTAISLPGSTRLLYKVVGQSKNLNYQANSELVWKTNGDNYELMMRVSAFLVGSRSMTSVGKITGTGLAPTRFADKFRAELAAHFEADKGKITFSANTPDAPWIDGAQDRVSVFLQLGGMLAANPTGFPTGSNITFLTAGPRDADTWTFVVEAEESLDLMGTSMPSVKLTRKPRKEFDQKVEVWLAPALGYLPVRNRITQPSGDFVDQQLTEVVR